MSCQQSLDHVRAATLPELWELEPYRVPPDKSGLDIIHERADSVGAKVEVRTQTGQGTTIVVTWKADRETEAPATLRRSARAEERTGRWAGMIRSE